jgi:hypothetical protein
MLGLQVESGVILLRNDGFLPLPHGPGEVALSSIAERLSTPVEELILALTRSLPAEVNAEVTPPHAQTTSAWSA